MTESFKRDDGKRRAIKKKKEVLAVKKKKQKKIVFLRQFWRQLDSTGLMEQIFFLLRHPFQKSSWRHSERHRHTLQTTQSRRRPFPLLGGGRASKAKDRSINNSGSSWGVNG